MSDPVIEFLFDVGSPNVYLAHRVIPEIEDRSKVRFDYVPVLLGGIFKATDNQSPATAFAHVHNKVTYEALERDRFVARHGIVGFGINPDFPINTLQLMRGAVAAKRLGIFKGYIDAAFEFMWRDHRKMDDPAVALSALAEAGLPADEIVALSQDPSVKAELLANTQRAVKRGAFGAPTFFVGDQMWFGKDRLGDVEEAAKKQQ